MTGAFAEFERALIKERQREGIILAKQRGAYRGRKRALSPDAVRRLRERIATGMSKAKIAREFGISRQTLYQYLQGGSDALLCNRDIRASLVTLVRSQIIETSE